ncbi:type VII secretion integral membrane protein EccD [Dactylosporangium sp. CS-033363]|uniref:type VII secretion integral membrane protein EccD n=1 Tax=Dactylosporangium sp. CS-033363 TaxID=3239935 RepID=UPI003D925D24
MSTATAGLARITINAPRRRVDVAVPDAVPLAELLPELLQHAGKGLADEGERHGGWLLRRADGTALSAAAGLAGQGVRDGAVLHLVPALTGWPELEYDDVVEAIAADARRQGVAWSPAATRATTLGITATGLFVALVVIARADLPLAAAAVAVGLLLSGIVSARVYGDALVGSGLAAFALPFAFAAGWLIAPAPATPAAHALLGAVALLLTALVALIGVAHLVRLFVAGATAGLLGSLAGLLATTTRPAAAAAVLLTVLVAGVAGLPLLAIRLGGLPMPIAAEPSSQGRPQIRLLVTVARTDEVLTGLLQGFALAAAGAFLVLARSGDASGTVLVAVAAAALLLRARTFLTARQRLPLIAAGVSGFALIGLFVPVDAWIAATLVPLICLFVTVLGMRQATRPASPYLGRAGDVIDALCLVAMVPLACAVLGLYGLFA